MLKHLKRILINSSSSSRNLITWNYKQSERVKQANNHSALDITVKSNI